MKSFERLARSGYTVAILLLFLALGFLITRNIWGLLAIAVLEAPLWASRQYFIDRHGERAKPQS